MTDPEHKAILKAPSIAEDLGEIVHGQIDLLSAIYKRRHSQDLFDKTGFFDFYLGLITGATDIITKHLGLRAGGSFHSTLIVRVFGELREDAAKPFSNLVFEYMETGQRPDSFDRGLDSGESLGKALVVDKDARKCQQLTYQALTIHFE